MNRAHLTTEDEAALLRLAAALVNQHAARSIVGPQANAAGCWFGGGNLVQAADGSLLVVGRYRNAGDSRTGTAAGQRGLELAVFRAAGVEGPFEKMLSFNKASLNVGSREVLSIEGAALRLSTSGAAELFVSSEKSGIGYPDPFAEFLKPGTGVWTIELLQGDSLEGLAVAPKHTVLASRDPRFLHVKDPFLYQRPDGELMLFFCSHPYCWTSSNSGYALLRDGRVEADTAVYGFFPRGFTWDVAITRATCVCDVPAVGRFRGRRVSLLFYDGGESIRNLDEHASAIQRPRGYSCEEIGGAAYVVDGDFAHVHRLSQQRPLFTSPWGTGCSRYVDVLATDDGMIATWQQSQEDESQPLVMHFVAHDEVERLLQAVQTPPSVNSRGEPRRATWLAPRSSGLRSSGDRTRGRASDGSSRSCH